jgi:hypothetical protein
MHYHAEIIMPPTDDVKAAVATIMAEFDENANPNDENVSPKNAFWDWYVIGGQWSGQHITQLLGERLNAFYEELDRQGVTVSGLQMGKPTLNPASQRAFVDALWVEAFPESPMKVCPLFDHYKGNAGDVMPLSEVAPTLHCDHAIIVTPGSGNNIRPAFMIARNVWNGVNYVKTTWDGTIGDALRMHADRLKNAKPEYIAEQTPGPDWLIVTVDYHS